LVFEISGFEELQKLTLPEILRMARLYSLGEVLDSRLIATYTEIFIQIGQPVRKILTNFFAQTDGRTWPISTELATREIKRREDEQSKAATSCDQPITWTELEVACDVIESMNFAKYHTFYDVTSSFELDFRARG